MNFVSLGGNCSVAYQLDKLGLRHNSYPFDWCRIKINKLIQVLNNNFNFYEDIIFKKKSFKHDNNIIVKNNYNIEFAHELINKYEIDNFKLILLKRIELFKQLKNPIFVRLEYENLGDNKIWNDVFWIKSEKKVIFLIVVVLVKHGLMSIRWKEV